MTTSILRRGHAAIGWAHRLKVATTYSWLIGLTVVFLFPLFWMVITSLTADNHLLDDPPQWLPNPVMLTNYLEFWRVGPVPQWLRNSTLVAVTGTMLEVVSSLLVAFGFARRPFPGSRVLFIMLLGTMMIPHQVTIIPTYVIFREIQWLDTLAPLIVPHLFGSAFAIFLLRQFFLTLPRELDEAATIDGANSLQVLWHVLLPLIRPALATVVVFTFVSLWTDFFSPFVYINSPEWMTLQVGLAFFTRSTQYGPRIQYNLLMVGSLISLLPMVALFFVAQKQFFRGFVLSGLKM